MVKSWAPEPPEDRDDHLPVLSSEHLIFPQSEDSDDMHDHPDPPTGYTLFANTNVEDHSNDDRDDSDDDYPACTEIDQDVIGFILEDDSDNSDSGYPCAENDQEVIDFILEDDSDNSDSGYPCAQNDQDVIDFILQDDSEDSDDGHPVCVENDEAFFYGDSEDSDDGYPACAENNQDVSDFFLQDDSDDSDDGTSIGHLPASSETIPQSGAESHSQTTLPTSNSDSAEVCKLFNTPRPTADIVIDCEEVRAAMAAVTLPPSAFPPWAVGVSDSELTNQIQRLLNKTTSTDSNTSSSSTAVEDSE